jgi:hypothetical protein
MTGAGVLMTILNGYGVNHIFCARLGVAPVCTENQTLQ